MYNENPTTLMKLLERNPDYFQYIQDPDIFLELYEKYSKKESLYYYYFHENCKQSMKVVQYLLE